MEDLAGAGGAEQPSYVLRYRLVPWLCTVLSLGFLVGVVISPADAVTRGVLGFFAVVFGWSAAMGFCTTYEVRGDLLVVRGVVTRTTVVLSRLISAETVRRKAGRGAYAWELVLYDQQGNSARMNFDGSSVAGRRRLMSYLAPYIMAEGVRRSGQVENALAGGLFWPYGSRTPGPEVSRRPHGVPGKHELR